MVSPNLLKLPSSLKESKRYPQSKKIMQIAGAQRKHMDVKT